MSPSTFAAPAGPWCWCSRAWRARRRRTGTSCMPTLRVPRAFGHPAARIPPHSAPDARTLTQEHPAARPQYLPVLRRGAAFERIDSGPRGSAFAGRSVNLGKSGCLLPHLQPAEGQSVSHRSRYETDARARAFNLHTSRHIMRLMGRSDDKWRKYLLLAVAVSCQLSALSEFP